MVSSTSVNEILATLTGANKHQLDRNALELRKAGILKSKGRGRNAASVNEKDATNIILALLGARTPKEAPEAVTKLGKLIDNTGKTLSEMITEIFLDMSMLHIDIENPKKSAVAAIRVNRSWPLVTIIWYRIGEDGHTQNWEQYFEDPEYDEDNKPGFQTEALLDAGCLRVLQMDIKNL